MNTPISWIKAYVPDLDVTPQEFVDKITLSGSHVENYNQYDKNLEKIVVGKVLSIEKHPDADKLVICQVDVGENDPIQIVTGASSAIEELGSSRELYPEAPEDGIYIFPDGAGVKPGDDAVKALGLDDTNVEYEITSNRVDCFSIIGMAREAAATFDLDLKLPEVNLKEASKEKTEDYISVDIQDTKLCKRYIGRVVKNVKIGPSPKWMQDRLRSQGIRAINNIVDITNYVMEEMGQPMHAFDLSTIADSKIVVRCAKDGDKFTTLDGVERELDKDVLMICDGEKEVAIAGIMGGENSMVTESMDTLLFEAACFDGNSIRKTERRLGLRTDSAGKFEKGLDPNLAEEAINRACQLVEEMGCGEVLKGSVDVYPEPVEPWKLPYEPEKMNALLGLDIPVETQLHIYDRLGLTYNEEDKTLTIPTFRQDLRCMADLAEEIARIYGYDRIPSTLPTTNAGIGGISYNEGINRIVRSLAEENGFSQAMCYSFESPKVFDKLLIPEDSIMRHAIKITNPLGEDFSIMRTLPLNGLLTSLSINYNRRNKDVRLYELGKVYLPKELPLRELPNEKERLALGMYGKADFFDLKGVVEEILSKLGFGKECDYVPTKDYPFLHPGRQADIMKGKLRVGYIGQLHPEAALNYDMKGEVYIAVINMDVASMLAKFDIKYSGIAKFPASTRDLALVCDKSVYVGNMEKIIRKNAGKFLENLELFDVYEGEQVAEGKKSVAFSLSFRAQDHTLKDDEVNPAIEKILSALSAEGIEIRA